MADAGRRTTRGRLDQPVTTRRGPLVTFDPESFGRTTETIARFLGTGRYLIVQSAVIVLWMVYNALPGLPRFDPFPYLFLTLALSLQAAYAAPLILLAQNRQDDRDRVNLADDRDKADQGKADLDYLAREIAAIRVALGDVATRDFVRSELARLAERDPERPGGRGGGKKKRTADRTTETTASAADAAGSAPAADGQDTR